MADNGYGSIENSADFNLRVYRIRPEFKTATGGSGAVAVEGRIELKDPKRYVPFPIVNEFTRTRVLTGSDFDLESLQKAPDGTLWFGEEFGPFLLHTSATGKLLQAPIPLPDVDKPGLEVRAPQNPFSEESSALRVMNAFRADARRNGNVKPVIFSPSFQLLKDGNPANDVESRTAPPAGSGLKAASSEIFDVASLQSAGFPVVPYTINDTPTMQALLKLGVKGIISDRSDLLLDAVSKYDANGDGEVGDYLGADGLIDINKFDAQGHRGSRNLRPENTLPAMEAGLDNLMTTLETDTGVTKDGTLVLNHDPYVQATKCRRADGTAYVPEQDILIKNLTLAQVQSQYICDKLFRGATQLNDRSLSPVAVAFAKQEKLADPYAMPTAQQLFDFADFYTEWYRNGPGKSTAGADKKWKNAARVHFNVETKVNPRTDKDTLGNVYRNRTIEAKAFADELGALIESNDLEDRADVQSFDFRTLLEIQHEYPDIQTVYLFGDFPSFADQKIAGSDDGTNLQPQGGDNTPWLAGVRWPYRVTALAKPFRAQTSGGFEGMALTSDGKTLLPLIEKPLVGDAPGLLRINAFDIATRKYTGARYGYPLDVHGTNIGDFVMFSATKGVVIERDASQGDLNGYKTVHEVTLGAPGTTVGKALVVDLLKIDDPAGISGTSSTGDIGLGNPFAFPFTTIEDVVVLGPKRIGVLNDNNYPFSVGRHVGSKTPDDNEFVVLDLDRPLGG